MECTTEDLATTRRTPRVLTFVFALGLVWGAAALPAHACSISSSFQRASPETDSVLPAGEVHVVLHFDGEVYWDLDSLRATNELGLDIPLTAQQVSAAILLRFDTTDAQEVTVFTTDSTGWPSQRLASYTVGPDAPDLSVPAAPVVRVGETTCEACPEYLNSCCARLDGSGRLSTTVIFQRTEPDTVIGWLDGSGQLAGVLNDITYQSEPATLGAARIPPQNAPLVAMTVAGVMSTPVTWTLLEEGPCEVSVPTLPSDGGCVASPHGERHPAHGLIALGLAALLLRRRRRCAASG